jgi:hypothetical protein
MTKTPFIPGFQCPQCFEESLTYNGNYFCLECDWANPEVDIPIEEQSTFILELMSAYMGDHYPNYTDPIHAELARRS